MTTSVLIDPVNLSAGQAQKLFVFFQQQHKKGINFWGCTEIYEFTDGTKFRFKCDVIARERKKDKEGLRYEFIDHDQCRGRGCFGGVYDILGTLALAQNSFQFKQKEKGKKELLKYSSMIGMSGLIR